MKNNERLREIGRKIDHDGFLWFDDAKWMKERLDEMVKLLRTIHQRDAWHAPTCVCEVCEDTRRILAELEKGE